MDLGFKPSRVRRWLPWLLVLVGCTIELNPAFIEGGSSSTTAGEADATATMATAMTSLSGTGGGTSSDVADGSGDGSGSSGSSGGAPTTSTSSSVTTTEGSGSADTGEPVELTIFLTSTIHSGPLGGLAQADAICAARGQAAGLGTSFKAVMSDATVSAAERLTINGPVRDVLGQLVAMDEADLFDGAIAVPVELDENGESDVNIGVWSGTTPTGDTAADHCENWTASVGSSGMRGLKGNVDGSWIAQGADNCNKAFHLCCIEQP